MTSPNFRGVYSRRHGDLAWDRVRLSVVIPAYNEIRSVEDGVSELLVIGDVAALDDFVDHTQSEALSVRGRPRPASQRR